LQISELAIDNKVLPRMAKEIKLKGLVNDRANANNENKIVSLRELV